MQHVNEYELDYRDGDSGVKYLIRGPRIDWGVILLKPGQSLGDHWHQETEETFYVLEGEGLLVINGKEQAAVEGDVFRMEPQDRHDLSNKGPDPLKLVFIKCPCAPDDKVTM